MLSILDTNIFSGMFYFETSSCRKIFKGLYKQGHQIGICNIQIVEIRTLFDKIHSNKYKDPKNILKIISW